MSFLSSVHARERDNAGARCAEPTHAFCVHFDPLHGSTLDLFMNAQGLVYDPETTEQSSDPAMRLMHRMSENLQYTSMIAGVHTQRDDMYYAFHQGCFALVCYRGETAVQAGRDAIMFSLGVLFEHGDMLLLLERGLVDCDAVRQIKGMCNDMHRELVKCRKASSGRIGPLALGDKLHTYVRSLLDVRLAMRQQTYVPDKGLPLLKSFNEATLAMVRLGLLLGLRVGIAVQPPVQGVMDTLGSLLMLAITQTVDPHISFSGSARPSTARSADRAKPKVVKKASTTRSSSPVHKRKRQSMQLSHEQSLSSMHETDDDSRSVTNARGNLLSDSADTATARVEYLMLPRLLGHVELHSLEVAQMAKISRPFLFLDPAESGPEHVVRRSEMGVVEARVEEIVPGSLYNHLWTDAPLGSEHADTTTSARGLGLSIAFNGVVGASTEIAQMHELFDIVLLTSPSQTRYLQLTPNVIHPYLIRTRLSNMYMSSKVMSRCGFLAKQSVKGSVARSMFLLCPSQTKGDSLSFLMCALNTRLYLNIQARLEQRRRLTTDCFRGTGISGSVDLLFNLAKYWFTDRYGTIRVSKRCSCL